MERYSQTDVIALMLVAQNRLSRDLVAVGRGTSCCDTHRVTWTKDGEEPGDAERGLYRVTLQDEAPSGTGR